jgi:hypothetical protein
MLMPACYHGLGPAGCEADGRVDDDNFELGSSIGSAVEYKTCMCSITIEQVVNRKVVVRGDERCRWRLDGRRKRAHVSFE